MDSPRIKIRTAAPVKAPKMSPHANRKSATRIAIFGASFLVLGVASVSVGALAVAPIFFFAGPVFLALGLYARSVGAAVQLLNKAFNDASRGALDEAESVLDYVDATFRSAYIRRVADLQRAIIWMRLGRVAEAEARASAAITRPSGALERGQERLQIEAARALRALLRASRGDLDGARKDIEQVKKSPDALPETHGRAALAEAIVLEQEGSRADLREHLVRERTLLLEHTQPRERAIVRAYQRMLKARIASVYREGASRESTPPAQGEPELAEWVEKVAPSAAPFVRSKRASASSETPQGASDAPSEARATQVEKLAAERSKPTRKPFVARLIAVWILLMGVLFAAWTMLSSSRGSVPVGPPSAPLGSWFGMIVGAGLLVFLALVLGRRIAAARKVTTQIVAALGRLSRGDLDGAEADLQGIASGKANVAAAQAGLHLAALAERRADLPGALARCDAALARLTTAAERVAAFDILLPELYAERAFLLAALDREEEARVEMDVVAKGFPSYPFFSRAKLRVDLVRHARRGDFLAAAAHVSRSAPDLPLSLRDEMLADVIRASAAPEAAGAGEVARLAEELRVDPATRQWIEAVAPGLMEAFFRAGEGSSGDAEHADERAAEEEAEAALSEEAEGAQRRLVPEQA